jgi:hypothetical protein
LAVADAAMPGAGAPGIFRGYRRAVFMAAGFAVAAVTALSIVGRPVAGLLVAAGLAAGAWNGWRVQQSAPAVLAGGVVNKRSVSGSGVRRLGYLTLLIVACAVALRPDGWTIALGVAGFQLLLIVNLIGPLVREVRRG